jgi:hypothetical protein
MEDIVEKYIIKYSYILGVISLTLALVIRAVDVVAPTMSVIPTKGAGNGIGYKAFVDGTFLFFVTTIASSCYAWSISPSAQQSPSESKWNRQVNNPSELVAGFMNSTGDRGRAK